jgi:hypothetical protein
MRVRAFSSRSFPPLLRFFVVGGAAGVPLEYGQPHGDVEQVERMLRGGSHARSMIERTSSPPSVRKVTHWLAWSPDP